MTKIESAALVGGFAVMPLEELLQWLDQSGRTGLVTVTRPDGYETWISVRDRQTVTASPAVIAGTLSGGSERERVAASLEAVLDLFLFHGARFRFEPGPSTPAGGVPFDQPIGFVVMEGLRHLDEWPDLDVAYPHEGALLRVGEPGVAGTAVGDAILRLADASLSLGEARLRLGLSRAAMLRRVNELAQRGLVTVDGTSPGVDPVIALLAQAATLLGEGQYAEASLVFRSLLASDPMDARARQLLARTERLEAESLSRALPPDALVRRAKTGAVTGQAARVLELVADGRFVVYLVTASPLREVETLRTLAQLVKSGHVRIEARPRAGATRPRKAGG
jgi:hypothetical protein